MSKPVIGGEEWMKANPDRYAIYPCCEGQCGEYIVNRGAEEIDAAKSIAEAMDIAYAYAEARAALAATC